MQFVDVATDEDGLSKLKRGEVAAHLSTSGWPSDVCRRGFMGGGFHGGRSLPKQMALAAGVPGAELIPDSAELFLGFTSTQKAGLGPPGIANFETLPGYTDQWADGYFLGGTAMHLSHIFEDIEAWYLNFDYGERVSTTFRPGLQVPDGTQTVTEPGRTLMRSFLLAGRPRRRGPGRK